MREWEKGVRGGRGGGSVPIKVSTLISMPFYHQRRERIGEEYENWGALKTRELTSLHQRERIGEEYERIEPFAIEARSVAEVRVGGMEG